ncbi:MAG: polyphosphate kinase 2 family protein [Vicinamibacterales bacterium]
MSRSGSALATRYRITDGSKFRLTDFDPADTNGLKSKESAASALKKGVERLAMLQERLYAQDRWSVLLIFQAMDAAGKDGAIKHVMSGVNPRGCEVHDFKAPSAEELDHDFLWRTSRQLPRRGHIGVFNRSYYEETLVVRIHPEILQSQKLPRTLVSKNLWKERYEDINAFERYLSRQGMVIRKFFLYVSKEEQRLRFLSRLDQPEKSWKFSLGDIKEREHFDDYLEAYEDLIRATATEWAPWYVIPADRKWFARLVISNVVIDTIEALDPTFPKVDPKLRDDYRVAKALLEGEGRQKVRKAR